MQSTRKGRCTRRDAREHKDAANPIRKSTFNRKGNDVWKTPNIEHPLIRSKEGAAIIGIADGFAGNLWTAHEIGSRNWLTKSLSKLGAGP